MNEIYYLRFENILLLLCDCWSRSWWHFYDNIVRMYQVVVSKGLHFCKLCDCNPYGWNLKYFNCVLFQFSQTKVVWLQLAKLLTSAACLSISICLEFWFTTFTFCLNVCVEFWFTLDYRTDDGVTIESWNVEEWILLSLRAFQSLHLIISCIKSN